MKGKAKKGNPFFLRSMMSHLKGKYLKVFGVDISSACTRCQCGDTDLSKSQSLPFRSCLVGQRDQQANHKAAVDTVGSAASTAAGSSGGRGGDKKEGRGGSAGRGGRHGKG